MFKKANRNRTIQNWNLPFNLDVVHHLEIQKLHATVNVENVVLMDVASVIDLDATEID